MSRHYIAAPHIEAIRTFAPQARFVFDTVDLHFLREERLAELNDSAMGKATARARRDAELALIRKADATLVVSPVEKELLAGLAPDARVDVLTNIHEYCGDGKPFAERHGIVFIGGFQHPPNTDAVLWYAKEILPLVRKRLPGVVTTIVGSKVPETIRALAADDLAVVGWVPDVAPYFEGCRVSIAPLRYGAGVKGKVNLAMSYGLPVVATAPSVEGMFLTPGEDVLVADDAAGVRRRDRAALRRRGAVAEARRRRPREHRAPLLPRGGEARTRAAARARLSGGESAARARSRAAPRARTGGVRRAPSRLAAKRAVQRRRNTRSNTPWPSFRPRVSNLVCGR